MLPRLAEVVDCQKNFKTNETPTGCSNPREEMILRTKEKII